jgi:hypothetical protein
MLASQLETAAKAVAGLGSSTGQTMSSVRAGWSGSGAAAILLVSGELADGVAGTAAALEQIVTAIRGYVPFLTDAQRKVNAYNLCVADASIAEHDGNDVSAIGAAYRAARLAGQACQAAGMQAASLITSAAGGLDTVFNPDEAAGIGSQLAER